MKTIIIILGIMIFVAGILYLGKPKSSEGFDTRNKALMKGCKPPTKQSGNCGAPGEKGDIYMTKSIDDAKEEVWTICPYECPKGSLSDDISICKYDKQCATVDVKTGKFNHACIVKLNIHPEKLDKKQIKRFSSRKEMEKALGYKICSHRKGEHPEHHREHKGSSEPDMSDMIMNPATENKHETPVKPGGGAGPHGSRLPNPAHPGPGYPDAHGGTPDPSCYPPPPKHYSGPHPGINELPHGSHHSLHTLPHSPHAPFGQHGGFVPPHEHSGGHHSHMHDPHGHHSPSSHAPKYQCECS